MRYQALIWALTAFLLLPAIASADVVATEVTPFVFYGTGPKFEGLDDIGDPFDTKVDEDLGFGLVVDLEIYPGFQVELFVSRQDADLVVDDIVGSPKIGEMEVTYYHAGGLWEWPEGKAHPFFTVTGGLAEYRPKQIGAGSETLPSIGFGGGTKYFPGDQGNVGFRVEGRLLGSFSSDELFCSASGCLGEASTGSIIWQFQAAAGLVIRFD